LIQLIRRFSAISMITGAALVFSGCGGTNVELSEEAEPTEAPPPVPIEEAEEEIPGGVQGSSGFMNEDPGASS